MEHRAACCCGQLTVTFEGEVKRTSICHCFACQRRTGSAFGVQARVEKSRAQISGRATRYDRPTDDGDTVAFHFCPVCGSTVYWELDDLPDFVVIAVGMLADPTFKPPTFSVYEDRKHAWVVLPATITEHMA